MSEYSIVADSPAAPAEKLTPDQWAVRKGYVSRVHSTGAVVAHPLQHFVAGAKTLKNWDENFLVTEAEFDQAVDDVANIRIG